MDQVELVRKLVRGSIQRAIQESVAALIVVVVFANFLRFTETGSPKYYGCLVILVASGFISGVVWSFALSYRMLRVHPVSDASFWREAFLAQSRLLRLVPLWYLAPLSSGILLFAAPGDRGELGIFLAMLAVVAVGFAGITWLNRVAAATIDESARAFAA